MFQGTCRDSSLNLNNNPFNKSLTATPKALEMSENKRNGGFGTSKSLGMNLRNKPQVLLPQFSPL